MHEALKCVEKNRRNAKSVQARFPWWLASTLIITNAIYAVLIFFPEILNISNHCSRRLPKWYTAFPAKTIHTNAVQRTSASSSDHPQPKLQPSTGPIRLSSRTGTTTGSHVSAYAQPYSRSSRGVWNLGSGENRLKVENAMLAKGTATMKGVRRRVVGVLGRTDEEACKRGSTENFVSRRVLPMASGRERRSSSPSVGFDGSSRRIGVRV